MNIALFLLLSVQHYQTLSNNFDVELENGDHVVLPSNGDSQESYSATSEETDENGNSQKIRPRSQAGSIASVQQCRKCKTMKCIKEKCENVLLAIVQGCKLCKNNKACQKKRCPKDKDKQQLALLAWNKRTKTQLLFKLFIVTILTNWWRLDEADPFKGSCPHRPMHSDPLT